MRVLENHHLKALLAKAKVVIGGLMGDEATLQAMRSRRVGHRYGL
jgi:hypothetical protein